MRRRLWMLCGWCVLSGCAANLQGPPVDLTQASAPAPVELPPVPSPPPASTSPVPREGYFLAWVPTRMDASGTRILGHYIEVALRPVPAATVAPASPMPHMPQVAPMRRPTRGNEVEQQRAQPAARPDLPPPSASPSIPPSLPPGFGLLPPGGLP